MSEHNTEPGVRLWTREGFQDDPWRHVAEGGERGGNSRVILSLADFLAAEAERRARPESIGVRLMPADPVEQIAPFLDGLPLVALAFPAFNDGRSYSKAALLRTRHGYRGTVRASGDVLIDQIPLMARTGFDEFEVTNPVAQKRLEEGRGTALPLHYQPASDSSEAGEKYSWRRLPR